MKNHRRVAFALAAHPDDIEFMMAGTLILLKKAGYEIHYMNLSNGCCGSMIHTREEIARIRTAEAKTAAKLIGAVHHDSFLNDLEIFYNKENLVRVGAIMREVNPSILLVQPYEDYMEDHINAGRLAVTAAFCKGMPNFETSPPREHVSGDLAIYHTLPWKLTDRLCRPAAADLYVDITSVIDLKREMLAQHRSQKEWLDETQGLDSYLESMEDVAAEVGKKSGKFKLAEGWCQHAHIGFSAKKINPIVETLDNASVREAGLEYQ